MQLRKVIKTVIKIAPVVYPIILKVIDARHDKKAMKK
ncbi:hypothetical protein HNQ42_002275 [Rummeliibacillus stabekisii]|nr:hypothetical protein [Rummeliibacillus stabekisii]